MARESRLDLAWYWKLCILPAPKKLGEFGDGFCCAVCCQPCLFSYRNSIYIYLRASFQLGREFWVWIVRPVAAILKLMEVHIKIRKSERHSGGFKLKIFQLDWTQEMQVQMHNWHELASLDEFEWMHQGAPEPQSTTSNARLMFQGKASAGWLPFHCHLVVYTGRFDTSCHIVRIFYGDVLGSGGDRKLFYIFIKCLNINVFWYAKTQQVRRALWQRLYRRPQVDSCKRTVFGLWEFEVVFSLKHQTISKDIKRSNIHDVPELSARRLCSTCSCTKICNERFAQPSCGRGLKKSFKYIEKSEQFHPVKCTCRPALPLFQEPCCMDILVTFWVCEGI